MKVQAESFHLNGHIIGFRPQTQKVELPYDTPSNTLAVKGLIVPSLKKSGYQILFKGIDTILAILGQPRSQGALLHVPKIGENPANEVDHGG